VLAVYLLVGFLRVRALRRGRRQAGCRCRSTAAALVAVSWAYVDALTSDLVKRNGWTIAEHIGDRAPDRCQRLLNQAVWDAVAVMGEVRRFAVQGLDLAARGKGLRIGALDETGQQKKGQATAGVKRQHLGCAGGVNNGINTVTCPMAGSGPGTR
jgi:SRSO17 transposase